MRLYVPKPSHAVPCTGGGALVRPVRMVGTAVPKLGPAHRATPGTWSAVLTAARKRLAPGAEVFVRTRLVDDYRCGKGVEQEPNGWRLDTPETGEAGLFNLFYTADGLVQRLVQELGLVEPTALKVSFDNIQNGVRVAPNSDLVVWGAVA